MTNNAIAVNYKISPDLNYDENRTNHDGTAMILLNLINDGPMPGRGYVDAVIELGRYFRE